jgi:flagellin
LKNGSEPLPRAGKDADPVNQGGSVMASFSVVSNIASANAQANLALNSVGLTKTLNRLSSGYRINYSGDDAAGLAVANGYRTEQAVLNQGIRNANDGLSTLQIKDGALNNISTLLDRLATLASQSASGGFMGNRSTLDNEAQSILDEINREAGVAGLTATSSFSVFVSTGSGATVGGTIGAADTTGLSIGGIDLTSNTLAATAVGTISAAVAALGSVQGSVGALENRLQYAVALGQSQVVNTRAAESRIRDANIAEESANMTRYSILNQSGIASLAQANQQASSVLALLRG